MKTNRLPLLGLLLAVSVCMICLPSALRCVRAAEQAEAVRSYQRETAGEPDRDSARLLAEAAQYNEELRTDPESAAASYDRQLRADGSDVLCVLTIPSVHIRVPVYRGTTDRVLASGAGHLKTSSLPVGGAGTHAVITAHAGVPGNKLFTDLHRVRVGQTFRIRVLSRTLVYRIDKIRTIEPDDVSDLTIEPGKDSCSLVTCTPDDLNAHRLLVHGHRTQAAPAGNGRKIPRWLPAATLAAAAAVLACAAAFVRRKKRRRAGPEAASGRRPGGIGTAICFGMCDALAAAVFVFFLTAVYFSMGFEAAVLIGTDIVFLMLLMRLRDILRRRQASEHRD